MVATHRIGPQTEHMFVLRSCRPDEYIWRSLRPTHFAFCVYLRDSHLCETKVTAQVRIFIPLNEASMLPLQSSGLLDMHAAEACLLVSSRKNKKLLGMSTKSKRLSKTIFGLSPRHLEKWRMTINLFFGSPIGRIVTRHIIPNKLLNKIIDTSMIFYGIFSPEKLIERLSAPKNRKKYEETIFYFSYMYFDCNKDKMSRSKFHKKDYRSASIIFAQCFVELPSIEHIRISIGCS